MYYWLMVAIKAVVAFGFVTFITHFISRQFDKKDHEDTRWSLIEIKDDPKAVAIYAAGLRISNAIIWGMFILGFLSGIIGGGV